MRHGQRRRTSSWGALLRPRDSCDAPVRAGGHGGNLGNGPRQGDDIERLRQGDEVGFGTDTSTGSFGDATAWPALTAPFRKFWEQCRTAPGTLVSRDTESLGGGEFEMVRDEARGADLITFSATEGLSAAWLSRTENGNSAPSSSWATWAWKR